MIGINCHCEPRGGRYSLRPEYPEAVLRAGGVPFLLPFVRTAAQAKCVLERVDAVLFTGGEDLHPRLWGERPHPKAKIMRREKQEADLLFARSALRIEMPTLGVCYGAQLINVVRGGSVHQHLPDLDGISRAHRKFGSNHPIELEGSSRLRDILGFHRGRVNSFHHQGIRDPGRGFVITARAEDGVIEGIETADGRFLLGVQWHPERMLGHRAQRRLFEALVSAARRGR